MVFLLSLIGIALLIPALGALYLDIAVLFQTGTFKLSTWGELWYALHPASLNLYQALVDRECSVTGACEVGGVGQVRIGAEEWRAENVDGGPLELGATVRVVRVEGNRAIVRVVGS